MSDDFQANTTLLDSPALHAAAVTPSDSTPLAKTSRAIYVGVSGDVVVIMAGGETVTFSAVPAGSILPLRVSQVKATSTTASGIVSIW